MNKHSLLGRVLYALAFCVFIPALLINGACVWEPFMKLSPICSPVWGGIIAVAGMVMMTGAMLALKVKGGGLPMNAYPPPKFVSTGVYGLLPHPIYWGFCLCCAGVSVSCGSAAGLYVMTPLAALGCAAIVYGYEKRDLERRFGTSSPPTLLGLPPDNDEKSGLSKKVCLCALITLLWLGAGYFGGVYACDACALPLVSGSFNESLSWGYRSLFIAIPLLLFIGAGRNKILYWVAVASFALPLASEYFNETFAQVYRSLYFILPPVLFICAVKNRLLRYLSVMGYACLAISVMLCLSMPFSPRCFSILWVFIAVGFITRLGNGAYVLFWWAVALAVTWACVVAGILGVADILTALCIYLPVAHAKSIARVALKASERLANSWSCVMIGPWRVINHGLYVFLSAAGGFILIASLAGVGYIWPLFIVGICSLIGGGVWAQLVEGSSRLLRPFGYYGAIIGGVVGVGVASWVYPMMSGTSPDGWVLFAAVAVASPWIQAVGRLRCLVQGCCHGHPIGHRHAHWGIAHHNPASRVCRLTEWTGVPLHATPLYSIGFNLIAGMVLVWLWRTGMPAGLLIGLYFMLAGLTRFVEESYRGEPQTHRPGGLSVYQWLAIGFIGLAFIFWNIPHGIVTVPMTSWSWQSLLPAVIIGVIYAFCMSTDFPASNKRFARLTS